MKKSMFLLLIIVCISFPVSSISAQTSYIPITTTQVNYQSDGSYYVTTITSPFISTYSTSTKSGVKRTSYYNSSNKLLWTINVTGTFTYTGSSSSCTRSTCSVTNISSGWSVSSKSASRSGNSATAKATMHQNGGSYVTKSVTLRCSSTGILN